MALLDQFTAIQRVLCERFYQQQQQQQQQHNNNNNNNNNNNIRTETSRKEHIEKVSAPL